MAAPSPAVNATRLQAASSSSRRSPRRPTADWETAADINKRILELGPDSDAENRLAKALLGDGRAVEGP